MADGAAFLDIMETFTPTSPKSSDPPLQKALMMAEKKFGKLEGLNVQRIMEGNERQIGALIGFLMKQEKFMMQKLTTTMYKSEVISQSNRRRAFTVKKDGKMVNVCRNGGDLSRLVNADVILPTTIIKRQPAKHTVKPIVIPEKKADTTKPKTPHEDHTKEPEVQNEQPNISKEIITSPTIDDQGGEERRARREQKRKEIEFEKERLRQLEESRKEKTMRKTLKEEEQRKQRETPAPEEETETFLEFGSSDEEDEEEQIQEVYHGVFLFDGKYYIVDEEGDGGELVEYENKDFNVGVTSCARALLVSSQYNKDLAAQESHLRELDSKVDQAHLAAIVRVQAFVRRLQVRRLPEVKGMKERKNLVNELIDSEHKYNENLKILQTMYLQKILKERDDTILKSCLKNLEMIMKYNGILMKDLDEMLKESQYGSGVSSVFKKFSSFLKCYTVYVNSYDSTNEHIVQLNQKNKSFSNLLKKLSSQPEVKNLNVFSYLILPIQRVPRYELFIRGVLKVLPRTHVEYPKLVSQIESIKKVGDFLNERRRESENKQLLLKFKHRLVMKNFDITDSDTRRLCKYGSIDCDELGPVIVFLLSDTLLIHKAKTKVKDVDAFMDKNKLKIKYIEPLFGMGVYYVSETQFMIVTESNKFTFSLSSNEENSDWMMTFDEIISRDQSSAVSRLNTFRQNEVLTPSAMDDLFFEGYLTMGLKMFEDYTMDVVKFSGKLEKPEPTLSGSHNSSSRQLQAMNAMPLRKMSSAARLKSMNSGSFRSPRKVNDHEEEKARYCVIKGATLYVYNNVVDCIYEKWHMKLSLFGVSVESVIAINNSAAFNINICGKPQFVTAPSVEAKWRWLTAFRAGFYGSTKDYLFKNKIIPDNSVIKFHFPPPPVTVSERGKFADYLDMLLSIPSNRVCCDCGDKKIVCADTTYGILLCRDCSNLHKTLLKSNIVYIKSLYSKGKSEMDIFKKRGNERLNALIQLKMPKTVLRPSNKDILTSLSMRQEYIPTKYRYAPKLDEE